MRKGIPQPPRRSTGTRSADGVSLAPSRSTGTRRADGAKPLTTAALILAVATSFAQAAPIKPQTPDVKVPPPIQLPADDPKVKLGAQPLGVSEAVAVALKNQQSLIVARAEVRAAEGRTQQAKSNLLPQFGANAGITENRQFRGQAGQANRYSAGLTLNQLLFDFGRTRDQVRQQSALERAIRFGLEREEQDVVFATRNAFFNYLESLRLVTAAENNVANRQRQLDQADARVGTGIGNPADLVRAKTNMADAVLSLESARQAALNNRVLLAEQLGIDPRTPLSPTESVVPDPVDPATLNGLVTEALKQRPEMAEAQQRIVAAGLGVAVAKLSNAPSVNIQAGVSARGADDPLASSNGTLGVFLTWNFGDGGFTAGRTKEAQAQEELARANLEIVSQQVVSEVSRAIVDLATARQRIATSEEQLANARELLRISEGRFGGQIGTFLEVTDAQTSLYSAERNLTTAQNDARRAEARLQRALGRRS